MHQPRKGLLIKPGEVSIGQTFRDPGYIPIPLRKPSLPICLTLEQPALVKAKEAPGEDAHAYICPSAIVKWVGKPDLNIKEVHAQRATTTSAATAVALAVVAKDGLYMLLCLAVSPVRDKLVAEGLKLVLQRLGVIEEGEECSHLSCLRLAWRYTKMKAKTEAPKSLCYPVHTSKSNRTPQATGERLLSQLPLRMRAMSVHLRLRLLRYAWSEEDDGDRDGETMLDTTILVATGGGGKPRDIAEADVCWDIDKGRLDLSNKHASRGISVEVRSRRQGPSKNDLTLSPTSTPAETSQKPTRRNQVHQRVVAFERARHCSGRDMGGPTWALSSRPMFPGPSSGCSLLHGIQDCLVSSVGSGFFRSLRRLRGTCLLDSSKVSTWLERITFKQGLIRQCSVGKVIAIPVLVPVVEFHFGASPGIPGGVYVAGARGTAKRLAVSHLGGEDIGGAAAAAAVVVGVVGMVVRVLTEWLPHLAGEDTGADIVSHVANEDDVWASITVCPSDTESDKYSENPSHDNYPAANTSDTRSRFRRSSEPASTPKKSKVSNVGPQRQVSLHLADPTTATPAVKPSQNLIAVKPRRSKAQDIVANISRPRREAKASADKEQVGKKHRDSVSGPVAASTSAGSGTGSGAEVSRVISPPPNTNSVAAAKPDTVDFANPNDLDEWVVKLIIDMILVL
ncbi:hypothetical protein QBC33DRAFT_520050 [Phialemonium atrogriseum]|uniref:Uncharacterized protein n=1 Tax=Phialemonium atrogriseum TaxID=1093897 RepID=A0AAJ0FC85_9PEZI|nr:uncharacterized protein QBC33DRAFT_520050 [Phialemonium atrogriseum]KAK1761877.1 hypothetical protein QBC33DRAFT_520050 [Phialemonium atrogriseum]